MTVLLLALAGAGTPADAACSGLSAEGAKCLRVAPSEPRHQAGDPLPEGAELIFNPRYYGLPPVDGLWRYYRIGRDVYRVDASTLTLIERVDGANRSLF